jgi:hypothetical protein
VGGGLLDEPELDDALLDGTLLDGALLDGALLDELEPDDDGGGGGGGAAARLNVENCGIPSLAGLSAAPADSSLRLAVPTALSSLVYAPRLLADAADASFEKALDSRSSAPTRAAISWP